MLTQKQIDTIIQKIVEHYQPEKIILFGSYATGNVDNDSDLDLCIIKQTKQSFMQRSLEVRKILRPKDTPMDILVFTPREYEEKKSWTNHIAYFAHKYGKVQYENIHNRMA